MNREALVVGINKYPFMNALKGAVADAVAIAKMLRDHGGFRVRLALVADKADGSPPVDRGLISDITLDQKGLEEAIEQLFNPPSEIAGEGNDTALLFFAGHGLVKDPKGVREGFMATSDADGECIWGVSFDRLRKLLLKSKVPQKLVWLDCCHSGEFLNFDEAYPGTLGRDKDTCLIAASRSFEAAEELPGAHGQLTAALLEALDPSNHEEGRMTNIMLVDYVAKKLQTTRQRPVYRNFGSEIVITGDPEQVHKATLNAGVCPYKGLEPFEFNDEDPKYFFGRTALVDEMLDRLREGNFLAVVGASGSGKSSAVKAGLLHQLKLGQRLSGSGEWKIVVFRPGKHPLESLVRAFERAPEQFDFRDGLNLAQLVGDTAAQSVVLVADQFEEVFTLCQDIELRKQFMSCLLGALDEDQPNTDLRVIITMRVDFLANCLELEYSGLTKKIQNHPVLVGPMNRDELQEAIKKPAWKVGLEVRGDLVERMISDVEKEPGSLPLLQYTLRELWQNRQENRLTLREYRNLKGVTGALQKRANEVYKSLEEKQQSAARWIFMNLTQVGEGAADTRRQALKKDLVREPHYPKTIIDETVGRLADARLLVTNEAKGGETTVDVAHEALIRHWDKLRGWVDENRKALIFKDKIEEDVREWRRNGKSDDHLLSPGKLDEAEDYQKQYDEWGWLSDDVKEYIPRSRQRQKEQVTLPQMRADAAVVQNLRNVDPVNSMVLAIKAAGDNLGLERYEGLVYYLQSSLLDAITKIRETNIFKGHENSVLSVAFSPDGKRIVSGSYDNTIRLWDLEGNPIGAPFRGHENYVWSVAFSPDGKRIVSGSYDNTIRLWDLEGNPIGAPFRGHENSVRSVAFSPDGKRIVSGSSDNTIRLWDLEGNPIGAPFRGHENSVRSVAFSPDGKRIVSGSYDKTIRLWLGGSCKDWLTSGCKWLQFHPVLAGPDTSKNAQLAVETCRMHVWDNKGKARFLMRQGWLLVLEKQDVSGAWAKFEEAHHWDANIDLEAKKKEATELVVDYHISKGRSLASEKGDVSGALAKFSEAHRLDDTVDVAALQEEAKKLAKSFEASQMVAKGKELAKDGKVNEALAVYAEAQQWDPELEISADDWVDLCWYGSLHGEAAGVMDACSRAVELAPETKRFQGCRGLARALTGDTAGAIEDFQAFIESEEGTDEENGQRQGWIDALGAGENPFTEEVLEELRQ